jgi:MFS family permease
LISIAFSAFNLLFNLYMSGLGFSNEVIGLFNSLPALALVGVALPFAALADRIGYRPFLLIGMLSALLGSAGLAVFAGPLPAVFAAGTFAFSLTVLEVLSFPLLAQVSNEAQRVSLFAVSQSVGWVAVLVGDLAGGQIPEAAARSGHVSSTSPAAIRTAFIATTALVVLAIPFLVRVIRTSGNRAAVVMPARGMLKVDLRRFAGLILPEFLLGIGAGMFLTFVQLYFAQRFKLTPGPIGTILAVGAAVTAVGTLAAPAISRRFGVTRTVGLAQMAGFPLILVLAFVTALPLATAVFYIRQITLNIQAPLAMVFGMDYVVPEERARLSTALMVGNGIGVGGIGPLASGFLQVWGGFQLAFSVAAAFYLLAGLTYLVLFGRIRLPSEGQSRERRPGDSL